jgi:hypothetical protein
MAESTTADPALPKRIPARVQAALAQAERAETAAAGLVIVGVLLMVVGLVLIFLRGMGLTCLVLGGIVLLAGLIQDVRAEVLRVRAKLEKD